jgi:hypothetical protein
VGVGEEVCASVHLGVLDVWIIANQSCSGETPLTKERVLLVCLKMGSCFVAQASLLTPGLK